VLEIPFVDPARAVGDEEDRRRESRLLEDRRRVLEVVAVAVVEREDDRLGRQRRPAGDVAQELREARAAIPRRAQAADLASEGAGRDAVEAQAVPEVRVDPVVHEDRHAPAGEKAHRAETLSASTAWALSAHS